MSEKKKSYKHFLAGGIAGAIDTAITMPLDTIKTNLQIRPSDGLVGCAKRIVATDGVRGLYFGFQPFVVQASGKAAVRFFAYDVFSKALTKLGFNKEANPTAFSVTAGLGAGACEATFWTAPTERIKVLRQTAAVTGVGNMTIGMLIQQQGVSGLYRGVFATALRQSSSVAVRFTLYEHIKRGLTSALGGRDGDNSKAALVSFLAGGVGGAVSVVINNPIDVIKSRIQSGGSGVPKQGIVSVAKEVYSNNGIAGFGAGLSARIPRLFLSQAIQFTIVDQLLKVM